MPKIPPAPARGFRAVDRFLGGNQPPTRFQRFAARRPLAPAAAPGLLFFAVVAATPGTQLVDVMVGIAFGAALSLTYYVTAICERARQRRLIREGIWKPTPP
ncbi:hypothetical protein [Streptomyces sp. NPDC093111]|uniref:hypothetical protein n=1 Tax=Streptomyces sp. NPDC093111 TaxID=3154978 RepID=UPI003430C1D2